MYSSEELEVLIAGLEKRRDLVSGHLGGMYNTMAEQRKGWEEIEREINSINFRVRTVKDIRHKWLDLKSRTKKKGSRINKSLQETGGGFPLKTKLTSLEERVLNLMGQSAVYGLLAGYDTSSVNEVKIIFYNQFIIKDKRNKCIFYRKFIYLPMKKILIATNQLR